MLSKAGASGTFEGISTQHLCASSMGISREANSQSSCLEILSPRVFILGLDFPKFVVLASDESQTAQSSVALGCGVDQGLRRGDLEGRPIWHLFLLM